MTAVATYTTGTVSVGNGATTVTGTSTIWNGTNARAGDDLVIGSNPPVKIIDVVDNTHLTILPWPFTTASAAAYAVLQTSTQRVAGASAMADVSELVSFLNGAGVFYFVAGSAPDPSIGDDGQFALKTTGGPWQLWLKTGGVWVLQPTPIGATFRGAWNSVDTFNENDVAFRNGSSYVSLTTNTNKPPESNPSDWSLLAQKGDTGSQGIQGVQGVQGPQGTQGPQGNQGIQGPVPSIAGTSTSSITLGTGAKALTTQASRAFSSGMRIRVANSGGSRVMSGYVTSYDTNSGALNFNVDLVEGSGSDTSWTITLSGERGPQGLQGVQGDGLDPGATGTLSDRALHDNELKGFIFLETDVSPFRLWTKASDAAADWAGPSYVGGTVPLGDLGPITGTISQTFDFGPIA